MSWLSITLIAYFLLGIAAIIDKTLLSRDIKNPFVYTFYIASLGGVIVLVLSPFFLDWPGIEQFIISILAGATFIIALTFMFWGLKKEEASRLTPMIGGTTPIFVFLLASLFLRESLSPNQIYAFILIIIGTFLISLDFQNYGAWTWIKKKIGINQKIVLPKIRKALFLSLPAAFFFAVSWVLTKDIFNHQPFWQGFIWKSIGALLMAFLPMLWKKNRDDLKNQKKEKHSSKTAKRFLFGQACGGTGNLLMTYAISIASVTLVQALQGTQYIFVFLGVLFLTFYFPRILKEKVTREIILQKTIAILLIISGIWFILI